MGNAWATHQSFSPHAHIPCPGVSGWFTGTWAAPGIFHYNKIEAPGRKQFVERKVSVERTQLKKLTVSSQTGCRKTSMVTFSKAEAEPKLAELRGAVVELSVVPTPSGAQNHAHVICRCWYRSRTCKWSNENRRCLQWCCTNMIAVLLPLQPYKHCAAGILSEKNTLLWCNHISFPAFCKPNRLISWQCSADPQFGKYFWRIL